MAESRQEGLSEASKRYIRSAGKIAEANGYMGYNTAHLALALLGHPAVRLLFEDQERLSFGLELARTLNRQQVSFKSAGGFTAELKTVILLATDEANRKRRKMVEPEDLLVGLVTERLGFAGRAFDRAFSRLEQRFGTMFGNKFKLIGPIKKY